jgi:tyrosine-protein phosphatase non-receptor type 23
MIKAQAQECVLEKSVIDQRKTSINAKISAQIIDYYKIALTNNEKSDFQNDVNSKRCKVRDFVPTLHFLGALFI